MIIINDEQKNIIEASDKKNVLVSAAAGSGKTTTLTERIIKLLTSSDGGDTMSLQDILVMTFTRKATKEMRTRIKKGLENIIKTADGELKGKLIRETALLQDAKIFTIDAFCKKIVDENYTYLNAENSLYYPFDPSYRIIDDNEADIIKEEVLDELLEEKYQDKKYEKLFDSYVEKTDESKLRDILSFGLKKLASISWPYDFLTYHIENFDNLSKEAFANYVISAIDDMKKQFGDSRDNFEKMMILCSEVLDGGVTAKGKPLSDSAKESLADVKEYCNDYIELIKTITNLNCQFTEKSIEEELETSGVSDIFDNVIAFSKKRVKYPIKTTFDIVDQERFLEYKDEINAFVKSLDYESVRARVFASKKLIYNEVEVLYLELLKELYKAIIEEKKKRNAYVISDYASIALDILYEKRKSDKNDIEHILSDQALAIADSLKAIFIDEYQDTNYVQENIISAISDGFSKDNVFMVGDVKQSIYKFRDAEPSIFTEKYLSYSDGKKGNRKNLSVNYRSGKEIIEYVNSLFEKAMTPEFGDIDYSDGNALIARDDEKARDYIDDRRVHVRIVTKPEDATVDEEQEDYSAIEREADYVADEIEKLVSEKGVGYGDIAILLRNTSTSGKVYLDALRNHNIPVYAEEKTGFFDKLEIKLMLDILKAVENPTKNVALASMLLSDVFNFTNDEIAYIKLVRLLSLHIVTKNLEAQDIQSLSFEKVRNVDYKVYDSLLYMQKIFNDDESISVEEKDKSIEMAKRYAVDVNVLKNKIDRFTSMYDDVKDKSRYLSVSDLIEYIYESFDIRNIVSIMPDGKKRLANLDLLYDFAVGHESVGQMGLFNINRYIEKIKEIDSDVGQAKLNDESVSAVRIMTIHKSKGLQFNTVFVCAANSCYKLNEVSDASIYQFDRKYGFALDYSDVEKKYKATTPKKALLAKMKENDIRQEEIRLLYVALTRAVDRLYIVGSVNKQGRQGVSNSDLKKFFTLKNDGENTNKRIESLNSYLDLVLNYYPVTVDNKFADIECIEWTMGSTERVIEEVDFNSLSDREDEKSIVDENHSYFDKVSDESVDKDLIDSYRYKGYEYIKPKFSVTSLKDEKQDLYTTDTMDSYEIGLDDAMTDKKMIDSDELSGAELGTLYHRYMHFYNYDKDTYDNSGVDSSEIESHIDKNKIELFLNSNLGKEMKDAFAKTMLYREQKFMKLFSKKEIDDLKIKYRSADAINESDNDILLDEKIYNDKCIIIQGIVDAFYIKKDRCDKEYIVLVDYKTDSIKKKIADEDTFAKILADRYKMQLEVYSEVLESLTKLPVKEKYIYSFAINKEIKLP